MGIVDYRPVILDCSKGTLSCLLNADNGTSKERGHWPVEE